MALAKLQATETLKFPLDPFLSAESYLLEMSQNYTNAGNIRLFKLRIQDYSGVNLSDIAEMLQNINSYGLSHLCAFSIFELEGESIADQASAFLDIYYKLGRGDIKEDVEFYSRGNKYYKTTFNNLFEYNIFNEQSGYRHWKISWQSKASWF